MFVARERPTASTVSPPPLTHTKLQEHFKVLAASGRHAVADPQAGSEHGHADHADAVSAEVVAIVLRARELGFSPTRVAAALDVSPSALAAIELAAPTGARGSLD